jgi:hypothetical protein
MSALGYQPEAPLCDGARWIHCGCHGGPDCTCRECEGCDACDPPCWECGCPLSEHPDDPRFEARKCEGCGPDCTGYEAKP